MSLSGTRRQALAGAAAGAVALPLAAGARIKKDQKAPIVEIFDSRGCEVKKSNYAGAKSGDMNDEQCVKVSFDTIAVSPATAEKLRQEILSFRGGFNTDRINGNTKKY